MFGELGPRGVLIDYCHVVHHNPPAPTPGIAAIVQQAQVWVTNASLKTLDTDYLTVVAAPGPGKYIEVQQIWQQKHGVDVPALSELYRTAVSVDETLTLAEAMAGVSATNNYPPTDLPTWTTGDRWIFFGTRADLPDLIPGDLRTAGGGHILTVGASDYAAVGTLLVEGIATKWWRITTRSYPASDASGANLLLGADSSQASAEQIRRRALLTYLYKVEGSATNPLTYGPAEITGVYRMSLSMLLGRADSSVTSLAFGGQVLEENRALQLGITINGSRSILSRYYDAAAYDAYLNGVDDVAMGITLRYTVHDTQQTPTS